MLGGKVMSEALDFKSRLSSYGWKGRKRYSWWEKVRKKRQGKQHARKWSGVLSEIESSFWEEIGRNRRETGMDQSMENLKQNTSPMFPGSRELQRAEQVTGSKPFACRFSCDSGTIGEDEPRWMENESKSAFLVPLMCLFKDCSSDLTFGHTI